MHQILNYYAIKITFTLFVSSLVYNYILYNDVMCSV